MADVYTKPRRQSFQQKSRKPHKEVRFGSYILGSTLGEGEFGKVKLCWRKDGKQPSQVAIKFIRRESIPKGSERESKVHREINALKRLSHPNIIKLEEVLQNDKYIGIVLEYASGGELFDYILQHKYLKDSQACRLFAQLVSGVHYMHSKGIVHRDLKLENLLLDKHKNIVITDFGFVNSFTSESELMKTSCGSPCYAAPELVISNEPYEARKVDIWSCGIILYAMLAGYLPFDDDPQNPDGDNIGRLYQYITTTPLTFPEYLEPMPRDLLRRVLVSNPRKRLSLREVRSHSWLAPHAPFLSVTPSEWDKNTSTNASEPRRVPVQQRTMKNEYRRYSLIDTAPSFHHSHSQQSSTLYAHPVPPQTSSNHAIAIPSSTSSPSIYEQHLLQSQQHQIQQLLHSQSQSPQQQVQTQQQPFRPTRGTHTRTSSVQSYSSASLALQAVVDADDIRHHPQPSLTLSSSSSFGFESVVRRNSDAKRPMNNGNVTIGGIPRSTTHTGISNLSSSGGSHLINCTIEESPVKQQPHTQVNVGDNFIVPKIPMSSNHYSQPHHANQKLPGPGPNGRGRQRPTSYHPGLYSSTTADQNVLDYQMQYGGQPLQSSSFQRSESCNSVQSLTNGNISKPSVDLVLAEGNITTPKSPALSTPKLHTGGTTVDCEEGGVRHSHEDEKAEQAQLEKSNSFSKKENRYSAVIAAEALMDKLFNTTDGVVDGSATSEAESGRVSSVASSAKPIVAKSRDFPSSSRTQRKPSNPKSQTSHKTKRFSLFGFYSSNDDDSTKSQISLESTSAKRNVQQKKKILEPSNDANISKKPAIPSAIPKKESIIGYTSFAQRKEPSTAKKVMDFFKRRSMRI